MSLLVQPPPGPPAMTSREIIRMLVAAIVGAASALGLDSVGGEPACPPVIIQAPASSIPTVDAGK